jgi:hypothetical protein
MDCGWNDMDWSGMDRKQETGLIDLTGTDRNEQEWTTGSAVSLKPLVTSAYVNKIVSQIVSHKI